MDAHARSSWVASKRRLSDTAVRTMLAFMVVVMVSTVSFAEGGHETPKGGFHEILENRSRPKKTWSAHDRWAINEYETIRNLSTLEARIAAEVAGSRTKKPPSKKLGLSMDHRMSWDAEKLLTTNIHHNISKALAANDSWGVMEMLNAYREYETFQRTMGETISPKDVERVTGRKVGYYTDRLKEALGPNLSEDQRLGLLWEVINGMADDPSNLRVGSERPNKSLKSKYDAVAIDTPEGQKLSPLSGGIDNPIDALVGSGALNAKLAHDSIALTLHPNGDGVYSSSTSEKLFPNKPSSAMDRATKRGGSMLSTELSSKNQKLSPQNPPPKGPGGNG